MPMNNLAIVLRHAFSEQVLEQIRAHVFESARRAPRHHGDLQVRESFSVYADPIMEQLLDRCMPLVENRLGESLYPTYSYYRLYKKGARLDPHKERPACEITLEVNAGHLGQDQWPLYLQESGKTTSITLYPGDAVLYRGAECVQWRHEFEGDYALQIFLHYVTQMGPHADWKFDRRPKLGPYVNARPHAHA